MDFTEAEIQVLASIYRIDKEGNRADRAAVEKRGGGPFTLLEFSSKSSSDACARRDAVPGNAIT
jgi:hypothetical protein